MTKTLPFIKMHGLGNDFIVIDDMGGGTNAPLTPELAIKMCDRRHGIGADQILWLRKPQDSSAATRMEILNSDGSVAEMCGNGIRAVALHLGRTGRVKVETLAGMMTVEVQGSEVDVDMGKPKLGNPEGEDLTVNGRTFHFHEVSMGNPHAVIFEEAGAEPVELEKWGPLIERHPRFPKRTNVEFVRVTGRQAIDVRVWERGAGITLACGTGACGAAVATIQTGRAEGPLQVKLPGGILTIDWKKGEGNSVRMKGPAVEVFRGEWPLS